MTRDEILEGIEKLEGLEEYVADPKIDQKITCDGVYNCHKCNNIGVMQVVWIKNDSEADIGYTETVKEYRVPGSLEALKDQLAAAPEKKTAKKSK